MSVEGHGMVPLAPMIAGVCVVCGNADTVRHVHLEAPDARP